MNREKEAMPNPRIDILLTIVGCIIMAGIVLFIYVAVNGY